MSYKQKSPIATIQGGTGLIAPIANQLLVGKGSSALSSLSNGTANQFLTSQGLGNDPSFQSYLGNKCIFTTYTSGSGTHTLNIKTKVVTMFLVGGGASGESGASDISGSASGGNGGFPGGMNYATMPVDFLGGAGTSVAYSVGSGGAATARSNGVIISSNPGSNSTFGSVVAGGGLSNVSDGSFYFWGLMFNTTTITYAIGLGSITNGGSAGTNASFANGVLTTGAGGGGSGGNSSSSTSGGNGSQIKNSIGSVISSGGVGGTGALPNGGNGENQTSNPFKFTFLGGTGGGGGGYNSAGTVGNGGNGGFPGGGGGAGSGAVSPIHSGTGGAGADGVIYVFEYL